MFQVKCQKEKKYFHLTVTNNGYQWTTIRIPGITEGLQVIEVLLKELIKGWDEKQS